LKITCEIKIETGLNKRRCTMFEAAILITFLSTWILAWIIFRKKYRWNLEIEQSPNLNGKIFVFCDPVPNEGVRIRIIDKEFI
tara:strand:+ start:445 stop:693 length:249 start_codon:yes stop_codon:yes gene_type:complete